MPTKVIENVPVDEIKEEPAAMEAPTEANAEAMKTRSGRIIKRKSNFVRVANKLKK